MAKSSAGGRSHEEQQEYIAKLESRTAELETTVQDQIAAGTEEKKRLRELVDANTKDLAELSAEWGQRNQLQASTATEPLLHVCKRPERVGCAGGAHQRASPAVRERREGCP